MPRSRPASRPRSLAGSASLLAAVSLLASLACASSPTAEAPRAGAAKPAAAPAPAPPAAPPAASSKTRAELFSGERAFAHLQALTAMGPRGHGLPGQAKAQDYIREHLRAQGATVRELSFFYKGSKDAKESRFLNIVGSYGDRPKGFVIIGSHYDTRLWADEDPDPSKHETPILGANDGGSGTAVLLELATVLHERRPPIGIELVFFDGEDYGRKGSSDYFVGSKDMLARFDTLYGGDRPACVVVIDMVGDKDLRFLREGNSSAQVPWLNQRIWNAGQAMFPDAFAPTGSLGVTDDHTAFLEKGIAATLLIDFTYPPWHTSQDTLDKCSPESLAVAGKTLLTAFLDEPFN